MSLVIDIADALTAELSNATPGSFNQSFVVFRGYRPQFDLAELKTLRVTVVPRSLEITSLSRRENQHEVSIDVAVQKKAAPGSASEIAELDGLMNLVEQIADFFRLRRLSSMPTAMWVKTQNLPIYAPEHLEQKQVFTSVLKLTYRVVR